MACRACPRLVAWREEVAATRRAAFRDEEYWARPVPGFGDPDGVDRRRRPGPRRPRRQPNRAGVHRRPLRRLAVSARSTAPGSPTSRPSCRRDDGLRLDGVWVTAAVRCAPPANRPTPAERDRCLPFLVRELALLRVGAGRRGPRPVRLRRRGPGPPASAGGPASVTASRPGAPRRAHGDLLVPPEPAEHLHRQADRTDARRGLRPGPAAGAAGS